MDRSWMKNRYCADYVKGLREFLAQAKQHLDPIGRTKCPCVKCNNNSSLKHISEVETHLLRVGMHQDYTCWVHHGEGSRVLLENEEEDDGFGVDVHNDGMGALLEDIGASINTGNHVQGVQHEDTSNAHGSSASEINAPTVSEEDDSFDKLLREARERLYPGSTISKLECVLNLLHDKMLGGLSINAFDRNIQRMKEIFPMAETLPNNYYEAKTLLKKLGVGYVSIHACKNDCVLFWKEHQNLEVCPKCHEPRYKVREGKGKKVAQKILRHFPLKPRLQRLFMSRMTAADMRWHKEKRIPEENVYRHPADSKVWEDFNREYEWFSNDARNIRLGLASDGFNPFGNMSNAYSMWPVMLIPYNLPPWKCMKEPFIYMSLLIPGPVAPGNDIDVYLQPLIDELIDLWVHGVDTYDATTKKKFRLHAALLWTINDFPAYANLSGWSTKGYLACPNCNKDTFAIFLKNGHKLCYMNHARFLPPRHSLRSRAHQVLGDRHLNLRRPKNLSGDDVLSQLEKLREHTFGKNPNNRKRKRTDDELNWTKKSIFFDLPYWRTLKLRHNLDVMHIEKNICEKVLETLMEMEGKTKDKIKSRLDFAVLGIRSELHLKPKDNGFEIPAACYEMSESETTTFCEWLKTVKFPDGYASNISRCVNVQKRKLSGLKSHDCHVLIQRVLPAALRGYLSNDASMALIELGFFFTKLCCKTLKDQVLEKMEKDIAVILSKLEHIFPPSFFDVMVHLAVHLPHEALLAGPVQYRWMYPIERFLHTLKKYVRNKAHPEGSIAEAYIDSECLTFCSMYLKDVETRFNREDRNFEGHQKNKDKKLAVFSQNVRPLGAAKLEPLSLDDLHKARYYVLNNCEEISPYLDKHMLELERETPDHLKCNLAKIQESSFPEWFQRHMQVLKHEGSPEATEDLYSLACGPNFRVHHYYGCIVNGMRFHTKNHEKNLRTQNSGVAAKGDHLSMETDFYGVLTDVLELEYLGGNRVFLFKCDWWDVSNKRSGIQTSGGFTTVNFSKKWYEDDKFVLATQANQVFYLYDTKLRGSWHVVQTITPRNVYDVLVEEQETQREPTNEAYQEEQLGMNADLEENLTFEQLNRVDVPSEEVQENHFLSNVVEHHQTSDQFIVEDNEEDQDDTVIEYFDEEQEISSSDSEIDFE